MDRLLRFTGFSASEFYCLLSAFDMPALVGLNSEVSIEATQEAYDRGIFSLFKRGILKSEEEGFKLREDIKRIFDVLKSAEEILHLKENKGRCREMVLYINDKDTVISVGGNRKDEMVMLSYIERVDVQSALEDAGYFEEEMDITIEKLDAISGFVISTSSEKQVVYQLINN